MLNGSQMTVIWHVDDLKLSQKSLWEIIRLVKWLEGIYGDIKVDWGKLHKYLGKICDFSTPKEVTILMILLIG